MKINNCISNVLPVYFLRAIDTTYHTSLRCVIRFMTTYHCVLFVLLLGFVPSLTFGSADSLIYNFNFFDTTKYDTQLSADIDLKTESGKILLASGDAKNLAIGSKMKAVYFGSFPLDNQNKPDTAKMNGDKLHDENFFTYVEFTTPTNVGSLILIDLRAVRKVNRIVVVGLGNASFSYNLRPQAFSYYAGLDSNRLSRIFQEFNNLDSARHTAFISDPQPIRYIVFGIDKQHPTQSTVISEFQIFGEGFVTKGIYVSKIDSTSTLPTNFANVYVDAEIPTGTSVAVEFRTGSKKTFDSTNWSDWSKSVTFHSPEEAAAGAPLVVAEPRKYFQYRLTLFTSNLSTPKVRGIKIVYQNSLIADSTSAEISPKNVPVLSSVTLTYSLQASLSAASLGIDTLKITTPSPALVRGVRVNGGSVPYNFYPSPNKIIIGFPSTLVTSSVIDVVFSTKLIEGGSFPSELISKGTPWNPQSVDASKTTSGNALSVQTTGIPETPLVDLRIDPNPFTPNGDGKNDATVIDFSVANIDRPKPLRITVYDLSGRKIRTVADLVSGINPFFGDPRTGGKGFLWDGKDDNGKLVRPGMYILQVTLDVDNGGQFVTKSVVVAY